MQPDIDKRHGGPWDRGKADSYYSRSPNPHYYNVNRDANKYHDFSQKIYEKVEMSDMSDSEISEYYAGYEYNEMTGDRKDWG
jgi:hypothetical protein